MASIINFEGPDPAARPLGIKSAKRPDKKTGLYRIEGYLPFDVIVAIYTYTKTGETVTLRPRDR